MTIEEGNKLIYDFLNPESSSKQYFNDIGWNHYCLRRGYHGNWNSLINALNKIEELGVSTDLHYFRANKLHTVTLFGYSLEYDCTSTSESKIKALYEAVVKFIKWYNNKETKNYGIK